MRCPRLAVLAFALPALAHFAAPLAADCVQAWPTGTSTNDTWGPGHLNSNPSFAFEREVADDFDFTGRVTRIYVSGFNGGPTGSPTPIDGVWVRFYAWTASGPGVLQAAYFVAGSDPLVGVEARPSGVEVGLAAPFVASGKHFVSVQVDFSDFGWWEPWRCNQGAPRLSTGWVRSNAGAWSLYTPPFQSQPLMADVDFVLYTDPAPACSQWSALAVPAPNQDSGLVDVEVVAANDVWALGNKTVASASTLESFPFALHHDGATWSIVDLPPTPPLGSIGSRSTMEALAAVSANDIWAAGARYVSVPGGWVGHQIRADHFDGTSWTTMDTPLPATSGSAGYTGSHITDIEAFATNDVWFVGEWVGPYPGVSSVQPALALHWDGNSFQLVPTPEVMPIGGNGLDAIDGAAPNDVWAVGGSGDGDLASYSYVLHWNGSSWSRVPAPTVGIQQRLRDVLALAANDVWSAGEALTASGMTGFVQHWDGASWSNVTGAPANFTASFHANAANDLWLGLWHWDGASWSSEHLAGCELWSGITAFDGGFGRRLGVGANALPGRVPYVIERVGDCSVAAYCTSGTTTNGCAPVISGVGLPSASATSGFTLRVAGAEGQRQGLIFHGTSGAQALPWAAGSSSYLCVKLPTQRMSARNAGGTLQACDGVLAEDWNAFMSQHAAALGQPRAPGQTIHAQAWQRDPPAPKTTSLSNALVFTLLP